MLIKAAAFIAEAAAKIKRAASGRGVSARTLAAFALLLALLAVQYISAPLPAVRGRSSSLAVTDKNGFLMRGTLSADGEWRLPIPLAEMGRWMPRVIVALEDRRFGAHNGAGQVASRHRMILVYRIIAIKDCKQ